MWIFFSGLGSLAAMANVPPNPAASSEAVQVIRVKNPPERYQTMLWELGFRVTYRPDVWAMVFDLRMPGAAAKMLSVEHCIAERGIDATQRGARDGRAPKLDKSPQSARSWLAKNDPKGERLAQMRKKRHASRDKKQARKNSALIAGRIRPIAP